MGLFSVKPTRNEHQEVNLIADLDALVADPTAFRFKGRTHVIKPITTKEFYKYLTASLRVVNVLKDPKATKDEVIESAHAVIASVCDSITAVDVENMTHPQITALLNLVIETVSGKSQVEKKKI